ncbi:MAG: acylneuraminate cytidylyltransferase family protein [Alphaproteobacteria bacterium]|nr:acylneuraminate cytidylyltransferase family protein [Alphaproteobacteria bacterium]MBU1525376.1 acylneuraminate cytidylyltransferase family protein [Alphaproteobacteria bacterium]MBU2118103.1 acylneuraminate cytidylyltransferase family protein [Alphaproteobacteria bacterium]MBU2350424.1 acylneuraminate cytidylyltransferase family protein [Alphaproteobacteria bacterium]MBU2381853.1 acylneuraminate cytidylyltransferase family protein [Alphaproteobacteria bacterium]
MSGGTIAIIPARAGSTRLPGKNVRPMAGRPMVAWTLEAALGARTLDRVVVSTDDPAVAAVARDMGLEPPFARPAALSGADASVMDAVAHALDAVGGAWDLVVLLQPTSPLRTAEDVDCVVTACRAAGAPAAIATSILPKPPAFYGRRAHGRLEAAGEALADLRIISGAVYAGRPEIVLSAGTFRVPGCLAVDLPPERAWDVDTAEEFAACEAVLVARPG